MHVELPEAVVRSVSENEHRFPSPGQMIPGGPMRVIVP
jgi:hypothetical protein